VLSISFFATDDGDAFQEAFFFNFSAKGAQLSDFGPEGRGPFKKLYEIEKCLKYLQSFWTLVYGGTDDLGALPVDRVLEPLLERLDTQMIMHVLSAEYIAAVIDSALRSLAAQLDQALPEGETKTSRQWWQLIQQRLDTLVFSKENQELFELSKFRVGGFNRDRGVPGASRDVAPGPPKSLVPAVVTPQKPAIGGGAVTDEVCFTALRHHLQAPTGALPCEAGASCGRLHPDKYKSISVSHVVGLLARSKGDYSDLMQKVVEESGNFRQG
jgi:hypothetical protein